MITAIFVQTVEDPACENISVVLTYLEGRNGGRERERDLVSN